MMKTKVFISHASGDYRDENGNIIPGNAISEIMKVLDDNQIERWIDETGLLSSKGWCQQIEKAILECNIFLYVSSEKANCSPNTANEIAYAIDHKKNIIPFKLDKSSYHKDVRLNLIRIHYLRYYEDRSKALNDLVLTINKIKEGSVVLDTSVRMKEIRNEKRINGKLISKQVLSVFNSTEKENASEGFKTLLDILDCKSEKGYEALGKYILRLQSLVQERNYNVRSSRIERLISDIKEDKLETERCVSIMIILLKMYLYFSLNDIKEVALIQKELNEINFKLSYIEKNADEINNVANFAVKGTIFVASVAAFLSGKGGSAAKGGLMGSTRGDKINIVKTSQRIKEQRDRFETLKLVSQSLIFVES